MLFYLFNFILCIFEYTDINFAMNKHSINIHKYVHIVCTRCTLMCGSKMCGLKKANEGRTLIMGKGETSGGIEEARTKISWMGWTG